jgi:excisionase family DNA binding protein
MTGRRLDTVHPDRLTVTVAVEALPHIRDYLVRHEGQDRLELTVDDAEVLTVPRAAVELLTRILTHMAAGQGVSVVAADGELTTQQAAEMLNVSRPYLIGLLDAGEIAYRKVGRHRRVKTRSLLEYLARDNPQRAAAASELTALSQDLGLI